MKTYKYLGLVSLAAASLFATQAFATTCPTAVIGGAITQGSPTCVALTSTDGGGKDLRSMFGAGGSHVQGTGFDISNDQYTPSANWQVGGTSISANTLLLEIAGNANFNSFGIYDPSSPGNTLQLFSGPNSAGQSATLQYLGGGLFAAAPLYSLPTYATFGNGATFGYYLNTPTGFFYSNPFLNQDPGSSYSPLQGTPHMLAYQGGNGTDVSVNGNFATLLNNEFLLAWEDQSFLNSDLDYNDFIVLVESVHSVPEPSALAMFGLGTLLIGLFAGLRRRREDV